MDFTILLGIILLLWGIYLYILIKKLRTKIYDPFGYTVSIITRVRCEKCGCVADRPFEKGDYVFKESEEKHCCNDVSCDGDVVIVGMFSVRPKSKAEMKYEELCSKWR